LNCYGVVWEFYARAGIVLPKLEQLVADPAAAAEIAGFEAVADAPRVGDVLCMWDVKPGLSEHLGVLVDGRRVLHSAEASGRVQLTPLEALERLGRITRRLRYR
jgi:hypothetical protein